jgi:hypothetical protein
MLLHGKTHSELVSLGLVKELPKATKTNFAYTMGRGAPLSPKNSIFDCPYEAGSDMAEAWLDGFIEAERGSYAS